MSFLVGVCAQLGEWLLTKLVGLVQGLIEKMMLRKKIEDDAKDSVQPLKDAKTGDEIDAASDDALRKF